MNDLENRLRDAFSARADLVTVDTLRRDATPPAPARRLPHWAGPTLAGLAVAATAAGVLVATGPDRTAQAPPADRPNPTVAPTLTPAPADGTTIRAAGWTAIAPRGWKAFPVTIATDLEGACLGADQAHCLISVVQGTDPAAVQPSRFGAGIADLHDRCRLTSGPRPAGRPGVTVAEFRCTFEQGDTSFRQLVAPDRALLAFLPILPDDEEGPRILDTMAIDTEPQAAPATMTSLLQRIRLTTPASWKVVRPDGLLCPPGLLDYCVEGGGIAVRDARQWDGERAAPRSMLGHEGTATAADAVIGCADWEKPGPSSFRVTVDRPVVVDGENGRYYEATMTCSDGRSALVRRWWLPKSQLMIDSGGRSATVDEALRTASVVKG